MRSGLSTFFLLVIVLGVFGGMLWFNSRTTAPVAPILPTQAEPTSNPNVISQLLQRDFGDNRTPIPTIEIPQIPPTRPVLVQPQSATSEPVNAADIQNENTSPILNNLGSSLGATPTLPPATAVVQAQQPTLEPERWAPPPLEPPLVNDPLGRDHIYFRRPVESNALNNSALYYYAYGSDGQNDARRIHHGIDISNPIGEQVYAMASGEVAFATDRRREFEAFQNSASYGNVVFIKHDIGYKGRQLYTLYAHLQAALVEEGDRVEAGQAIGLMGATGDVTGPHVHVEVRMPEVGSIAEPRYGDTYNPVLWIVPYVGHGIVAGRVVNENGVLIDDALVTLRNVSTGLLHPATMTTYVFAGTVNDVNPDPVLRENFAIGDVPAGPYDVIVEINGRRVVNRVEVFEGIVSFVELKPPSTSSQTADADDETVDDDG